MTTLGNTDNEIKKLISTMMPYGKIFFRICRRSGLLSASPSEYVL